MSQLTNQIAVVTGAGRGIGRAIAYYFGNMEEWCDGIACNTFVEVDGQRVMNQDEITVRVVLNRGDSSVTVWTCDFSYDYVKINASYRS